MADDLNNEPTGTAPRNAAPVSEPAANSNGDPAQAIGYEAADPSLYAAFWSESLEVAPSTRYLR